MYPTVFIECSRDSTEFTDMLLKAHSSVEQSTEERIDGSVELIRIAVDLTPAVLFTIGCYFSFSKLKCPR
jgi:hypothetical protein